METASTTDAHTSSAQGTKAERKRSEVEAAARAAGVVVSTSGGGATQLLRFASQLNSDELRLMELPQEVLQPLKNGDRWVVFDKNPASPL